MRIVRHVIIIELMALLFVSCHKDENPGTIEPGSYFPVYPGSFWKYQVNDSTYVIDSTSKYYLLYDYTIDDDISNLHYSNTAYVPWYYSSEGSPIGYTGPIFVYNGQILNDPIWGSTFWPILSEDTNFVFDARPRHVAAEVIDEMVVNGKYFNGTDTVLVLTGTPFANNTIALDHGIRHVEYMKHVGLVLDYRVVPITNDTLYKKVLVDYYIEK
jgi:hypothetical protein